MMSGVPGRRNGRLSTTPSRSPSWRQLRHQRASADRAVRGEKSSRRSKILTAAGVTRRASGCLRSCAATRVTDQQNKVQFEALEQYGQNLTQAREGKLDPVIGRAEGDPPHHPGAVAPRRINPRAHRRARHRLNGHRRYGSARAWPATYLFAEVRPRGARPERYVMVAGARNIAMSSVREGRAARGETERGRIILFIDRLHTPS